MFFFQERPSCKALLHKKFTRTKLIEFLTGCSSVTIVTEACAEAIYETASRPSVRFVKPRTESRQVMQAL
ncbi:IS110 family transposase, partial [Morganella morganii]|nr:IS110 family transposase [Morganella morganii]